MLEFTVDFGTGATKVAVELNSIRKVGQLIREQLSQQFLPDVFVVSDSTVFAEYGRDVMTSLAAAGFDSSRFLMVPGEGSKRMAVVEQIHESFATNGLLRDGVVLALGGGVVSDVAGFAAATWMRGVRFAICPTTMEADVDASLGGKTGVNLKAGKNLVGALHQPFLVAVDPACISNLSDRDLRAGLAESVKHALIRSEEFLDWHTTHLDAILALDSQVLPELIYRNLRIKGAIVEQDTLERSGVRVLLNFGHTVGHAIESCSGFTLRHGECVSLGMMAACRLSSDLGMLNAGILPRVEELLSCFGLPTQVPDAIGTDDVMRMIQLDKKRRCDGLHFVLLEGIGRPVIRSDVKDESIREAFESLRV